MFNHLRLLALVLTVFFLQQVQSQTLRIPVLEGWTFRNVEGGPPRIASVPGSIHLDLLAHQLIQDPFYRDNARHLGWVDSASWIYSIDLFRPATWKEVTKAELVFEGLDTYADVFLNDVLVLQADNMFREWRIPVEFKRHGQPLHVDIVFYSAIKEGRDRSLAVNWTYPADSDPYQGKPSVFTRKAPYQFGWDFAPSMPGCGIWKPVWLESQSSLRFQDVWLETITLEPDQATVHLHGSIESNVSDSVGLHWKIGDLTGRSILLVRPGKTSFKLPITLHNPLLWWPRGQGNAHLYTVYLHASCSTGLDQLHFEAGIRTIQLDQSVDSLGTSFRFIVNGKPLFIQGANWVPADMFPARVDDAKYRSLLGMAAEANMNMLRVWGGGIYEHDFFYHLADSLGILVWQDFIFAGTMYPGNESFLTSVKEEASYQIKRLRVHPSLALWCGNNEINVAWKNWGWQQKYGYTPAQQNRMVTDYKKLFEGVLPTALKLHHPGSNYLTSSPVSNWGKKSDLSVGNNHFWGVWHGEMDLDSLETWVPRFMSEYGMQSMPTWESIATFSVREDWSADCPVMQFHQKSYKGNGLIRKYMDMEQLGQPADFKEFVQFSHRLQAIALDKAITAHQKAFPYCMGTMLWQLNEPWPGASWSIIDYYGQKKPGFDVVKEKYLRGIENIIKND